MELDDELCLCFHVSKRKVTNFIRVERPVRPGQLSECFGAGTGCGWCVPFLKRYFDQYSAPCAAPAETNVAPASADMPSSETVAANEPTRDDYARRRAAYIRSGGGTPAPGATPLPEE